MSIFKKNQISPATLQFFVIFEKDKPIRVLPRILNFEHMLSEQMENIPLKKALSGNIMIPRNPQPWSEIGQDADTLFLALQSRKSWGVSLKKETNLLKVDSIRDVVLAMEKSFNNYSFRKDYLSGKFEPERSKEDKLEQEKPHGKIQEIGTQEGPQPGENWL